MQDTYANSGPDTQILHPGSRKLFAHWESLRAERAYPTREEFTFAPIKELMPDMILIERDYLRSSYRFRLAGSRVCKLFARNMTAADALAGWDSFERSVLSNHFELALRDFQPVLVRMRLCTDTADIIAAELLAMPIQVRESTRVQLIGGLFSFREAKLIGHGGIRSRELVSARTIWTEHGSRGRRPEKPVEGSTPAAPVSHARRLRLVHGGRVSH